MPPKSANRDRRTSTQPLGVLHIPSALLKIATVVAVTGLSESGVRRKVADGTFPKPIKDGARCTRWVADDIARWLCAKAEHTPAPSALTLGATPKLTAPASEQTTPEEVRATPQEAAS